MAKEITTQTDTNPFVMSIEFIEKFNETVAPLLRLLNIAEPEILPAGTQVERYKFSIKGELNGGTVDELANVPNTEIQEELADTYKVSLKKYQTTTSEEKVLQSGYDRAVARRDAVLINEIAKTIRKQFFDFLATGEGTAAGSDLKATLAKAAGALANIQSLGGYSGAAVFFANPLDVYDYLGDANVYNVENAFGFSYIQNFLGIGTVILDAYVPAGKVYATFAENINAYAADVATLNEAGFDYALDETGLIAVAHDSAYTNGSIGTHVRTGLTLFAENESMIVVGSIGEASADEGDDDSETVTP